MTLTLTRGSWTAACLPEDGGRLTRLAVDGTDLLTAAPDPFRPPSGEFGEYEKRPVYGYDDCFPSVDPCRHPDLGTVLPDHGEVYLLPWTMRETPQGLEGEVSCRALPLRFRRELLFEGNRLRWRFTVFNEGDRPLRFLHAMHALMPLDRVAGLELPACGEVVDERSGAPVCPPNGASAWLAARPEGSASMLLLRGVESGRMALDWAGGGRLSVRFPAERFPVLAVWWNRGGYPGEPGRERRECAFEPLAGPWSSLERAAGAGGGQTVMPGAAESWDVEWNWRRSN